jgi:hypothetical protein
MAQFEKTVDNQSHIMLKFLRKVAELLKESSEEKS